MLSCKKPPDHQSYGHQRDDHQNRLYQEFGGLESKIEQNKRTEADADAALSEALTRMGPSEAAAQVAKALGLDRHSLYRRALELKGVP